MSDQLGAMLVLAKLLAAAREVVRVYDAPGSDADKTSQYEAAHHRLKQAVNELDTAHASLLDTPEAGEQ